MLQEKWMKLHMTVSKNLGHFLEQIFELEFTPHFKHVVKYLINTLKLRAFVPNFAKSSWLPNQKLSITVLEIQISTWRESAPLLKPQ